MTAADVIFGDTAPGEAAMTPWRFLRREVAAQATRWRLWTPVAFGLVAAGYLELSNEPTLWALALVSAGGWCLAWLATRLWSGRFIAIVAVLVAFGVSGFLAGKIRSLRVAAPIAPASQR